MTGPVWAKTPIGGGTSASGDSVELSDTARNAAKGSGITAATPDVPQTSRIDRLA
jgi:hypothetical protein